MSIEIIGYLITYFFGIAIGFMWGFQVSSKYYRINCNIGDRAFSEKYKDLPDI